MKTSAPTDLARRRAFEDIAAQVYEPLQRYLRRRCAPEDADDVLNDTLLTIWRRLEVVPEQNPLPWCYGVARRSLANHRRSTNRRLRLVGKVSATPSPPSEPRSSEADVELHNALDHLKDDDRELVRLWAWERLEPREIAEVLDATPNAVSVRLSRIRRQLESEIRRQNPTPAGHEVVDGHKERET